MDKDLAFARLTQVFEYLPTKGQALTDHDVAEKSGLLRPHVTAMRNGDYKRVTDGNLRKFARAYSTFINEEWLLTGEGEMVKVDKRKFRPHYPTVVSAGFTDVALAAISEHDCEQLSVIDYLPSYDYTIKVSGDSMLPTLSDGDLLACKRIEDTTFSKSKVYVVDSKQGAVVKRISSKGDKLLCQSDNKNYKDFTIDKADVLTIAVVVGRIQKM